MVPQDGFDALCQLHLGKRDKLNWSAHCLGPRAWPMLVPQVLMLPFGMAARGLQDFLMGRQLYQRYTCRRTCGSSAAAQMLGRAPRQLQCCCLVSTLTHSPFLQLCAMQDTATF